MGNKKLSRSVVPPPPTADELLASAPTQFLTKQGKSSLKTLVSSHPQISPSLLSSLLSSISETLASFKSQSQSQPQSPFSSPPSKRSRPSETLDPLKTLECYAFIAHLLLSHPKIQSFAPDLLLCIQSLHDNLVLFESSPSLLSAIASLCELYWKDKFLGREKLISQSLPYFLSKSLSNGKKSDVHRVYAMREGFALFDYEDESIEDVRMLLVRCVIAPLYLKTEEGRKFLAFVMGLNLRLGKEVLAMVRSQIPFGRKSVLEAYGEILFRAWKGVGEEWLKEEIEDGFVQGLIDAAVHAKEKGLAGSIRRVLGGFIEQRATNGVEKLLFRLSEPVLFRSLQAANSNVRQNALHLFLDLFPLEEPDVTKEVKDTLLDKQFFLLEKLLLDDCPDVRAIAVEGSCRILNLFWEIIPSSVITKILIKLIDSLSKDACNDVRLSTVNGIIYLLENPQSHEIMKVLLPRMGCMFSDPMLSVRVAICDLLLAIRDIRTFQFNKVVGLDALLLSLANDHPRVAQKITRLLIPSYFPAKLNLKEACGRCIALIKRSPTAGARFCEFAFSEGSSSKSLLKLLEISIQLTLSSKNLGSDKIDGLLIASANICCSLSSELSNKTDLRELLSSKLKCLFTTASSQRAQTAVLTIASVVSSDDLAGLRNLCIAAIMNSTGLAANAETQALVRAAHKFMLSYGWLDELYGLLTNNLQSVASGFLSQFDLEISQQVVRSLKKKKIRMPLKDWDKLGQLNGKEMLNFSMLKTEEALSVAAAAAWQMKDLLNSADAQDAMLKSPDMEITLSSLRIISQITIEHCMQWELLDSSAVMAYAAIAMHISLQSADTTCGGKDDGLPSSNMPSTLLENSLSHLLNCAEKLFTKPVTEKYGNPPSKSKHKKETSGRKLKHKVTSSNESSKGGEAKPDLPVAIVMKNVVKIVTSILSFITDAETIGLFTHNHVRCLRLASSFAQYILSFIRDQQDESSAVSEEDLKEVLIIVKSSFSYSSKLLHLVLTSTSEASAPSREAFYLANDLLDLIVFIESSLGSRNALQMLSVAKPWLPVLILGLGSNQLIQESETNGTSSSGNFPVLPLWLVALAKGELYEFSKVRKVHAHGEDNEEEDDEGPEHNLPVFKKLLESILILLKKGNSKILDAIGANLLIGVEFGLEKEDFSSVLGLLHFTCLKLLGQESTSWKELELVPRSLQEIYTRIERQLCDINLNDDEKHALESARELLGSVCMETE